MNAPRWEAVVGGFTDSQMAELAQQRVVVILDNGRTGRLLYWSVPGRIPRRRNGEVPTVHRCRVLFAGGGAATFPSNRVVGVDLASIDLQCGHPSATMTA